MEKNMDKIALTAGGTLLGVSAISFIFGQTHAGLGFLISAGICGAFGTTYKIGYQLSGKKEEKQNGPIKPTVISEDREYKKLDLNLKKNIVIFPRFGINGKLIDLEKEFMKRKREMEEEKSITTYEKVKLDKPDNITFLSEYKQQKQNEDNKVLKKVSNY